MDPLLEPDAFIQLRVLLASTSKKAPHFRDAHALFSADRNLPQCRNLGLPQDGRVFFKCLGDRDDGEGFTRDLKEQTTLFFALGQLGYTKANEYQEEEDDGRESQEEDG